MKSKFLLVLILCLTSLFSYDAFAQSKMFQPGEELEYEVSFYGVKLGKIKVISIASETLKGKPVYKAKVYMDSYSGIPFVDLHAVFTSWFETGVSFSEYFESNIKIEDNKWQFQKLIFDYNANTITNEKWIDKQLFSKETIGTGKQKVNDGCSLFFLARQFTDIKKSVKIPTIIDKEIGYTYINFGGKRESCQIKAIPYAVKTIYFDGKAEWEGIYGLSGKFEGWFSDDEARVPIKAKMNVYVGSVLIELVKYKRANWAPPKAA